MDMVERVARALCDDTLKRWRSPIALQSEPWREFIPAARAAIAAMREPNEVMGKAGGAVHSGNDYFSPEDFPDEATKIFVAMIDAALSRQREGE